MTRKRTRRANVTITENSNLPEIAEKLKKLTKREVHIGSDAGTDIAMIAGIHEYGSAKGKIPARSFIGAGKKKSSASVSKVAKAGIQEVVEGKEPDALLQELGTIALEKTLKNFDKMKIPALDPKYAERKGSKKILQDHLKLRESLKFEIKSRGSE